MGLTNFQHALRKKYSALTGELADIQAQIGRIQQEQARLPKLEARAQKLGALIGSAALLLREVSSDWEPEQTPPIRPWTHTIPIPFGSCGRRGLDVLRKATTAMTVRQIATEVLKQAGIDKPDSATLQKTQNAIDSTLRHNRGRAVEASDTYPAQWRSKGKPGIAFDL
ncbi:hypothetical protein [Sphingobium subterraneum]|uniref:Uncharacterized protein n=1 Tax=Sphingobium subterraneum TaxID=627688 RepID=A0A841IZH2_9SPHN|nr:hypothetical protein [Sphingobium subterraneum]MBB6124063.1 hypothetical protein [Sphingobium subterraneum]